MFGKGRFACLLAPRKKGHVVLLGEAGAILAGAIDAAVVPHVTETEFVEQRRREDMDVGKHSLGGIVDGRPSSASLELALTEKRTKTLLGRRSAFHWHVDCVPF